MERLERFFPGVGSGRHEALLCRESPSGVWFFCFPCAAEGWKGLGTGWAVYTVYTRGLAAAGTTACSNKSCMYLKSVCCL